MLIFLIVALGNEWKERGTAVLGAAEKINSCKVWHVVQRGFPLEPDSVVIF